MTRTPVRGCAAIVAGAAALRDPVRDLAFVGEREIRGRAGRISVWSLPPASLAAAEAGTVVPGAPTVAASA